MAYKPPEIKREGCHYPNCSGYIEVPFCCHEPQAFPALKAKLAQIETPKKEWVGLSDAEVAIYGNQFNGIQLVKEIEGILKERNT